MSDRVTIVVGVFYGGVADQLVSHRIEPHGAVCFCIPVALEIKIWAAVISMSMVIEYEAEYEYKCFSSFHRSPLIEKIMVTIADLPVLDKRVGVIPQG